MGKLPVDTLRSSPTWTCNAVDLFEPIKIRDEVKKRTTGETYGVILNCLGFRAVHVDLAADYSTEEFLMVSCEDLYLFEGILRNYIPTTDLN